MLRNGHHVPEEEPRDRGALGLVQRRKLAGMLRVVLSGNEFYRRKFAGLSFDALVDPLDRLPFTTRKELEADQASHPPYGTNLSFPLTDYVRMHQTSGSSGGQPMRWLDTAESWGWWKRCWGTIYAAAGVTRGDRLVFPFTFGPFVGFWGAFEGAQDQGVFALAAGGMSSAARLRLILDHGITVICCTPTYALYLAEIAQQESIDLHRSAVRALVVAGEPGGHIPATRQRIESLWGARVFDHSGMTEIGPMGFECVEDPSSMHLMEDQCIVEVIDPVTLLPVADGEPGELVITNLGRWGSPVIRYRTGDQVRLVHGQCACGRCFARMQGGIIGRIDDMFHVRGNNVFPASVEAIVRRFDDVAEFRVEIAQERLMTHLHMEVEPRPGADGDDLAARVARAIHDELSLRIDVRPVAVGALPRFEAKARRFVRRVDALRQPT